MHNLFLTDTVDEQIHTMKPGTSSPTLTQRCTTKAKLRGAASSECPNINIIIALNIISCWEKFFLFIFLSNGVTGITETFIILDILLLASGTATWTLAVCHEVTVAKYVFDRNTSHKVSFSCHCYIYLTYSRTVWMHTDNLLKCYDHRFTDTVKENEKMSFWIAQKSKLNKLNVRRCFCSDS